VHATLVVQNPAYPLPPARARSRRASEAWLWLLGLLGVISVSQIDGLLGNIVPYERDTSVFYFPLMSWVGQQLRQGQFPLWTPQFFGGYPLFADGEIGLAYPPALLALLTLSPDRAFLVLRLVHLYLAAAGMFFLARTWRLPYPSAALAGLVFTLGNFLQAQIHHENIVRTASWLPLILACVEMGLQASTWRPRLVWTALASLALGLAGLSLHSQVLAIELLMLAAYGAMRWAVGPLGIRDKGGWLARLGTVARVCVPTVVVGLGLAAVQLVPLIELAGFSARGNGIPYDQAAAYSVTPVGLLQLVFPYLFRGQGSLQWGLWTHWESYVYIGLAPLVLATIALVCDRRREVAAWGIIGGLGLILSLGQYSPINLDYALWLMPGLSGLRAPGRFTFAVVLAGAMLAAYGLAWLMYDEQRSYAAFRRTLASLLGVTVALTALAIGVHRVVTTSPDALRPIINNGYLVLARDSYPLTTDDVLRGLNWSTDLANPRVSGALLGLAVVIGVVWLWKRSPWPRCRTWRGWPVVLVGLAAVDLLTFAWAIHPREPLSKIGAEPSAVQFVEQLPSPDAAPNRVLASPVLNQVAADSLAPFGTVQEANGYSSLQFLWHRDYLGRVLYADDALLDLWNVRYVIDPARFGSLSSFGGVNYLPQQALLHAPANSALAEQDFSVRPDTPITELRFVTALMGAVDVLQGAPVAEVELRDDTGEVVGTAELLAGRDTMDWAWHLPSVQQSVKHQAAQSAGTTTESGGPRPTTRDLSFADFTFSSPVPASSITVRATPPAGEFVLYGGAAVGSDGSVDQLFGKTKTKYRELYRDDEMRILENTAAYPRAFVVPTARVAPSLGSALTQMVHKPFKPDQEVILADDAITQSADLTDERGGRGTAQVTAYAPDALRVHTSTDADAWLVLSDTYYPGWTATIDGAPAQVLRGDVLFRVIPITGGEHDIELRFEPASVTLGLWISLSCLALVLVGLVVAGRLTWRRRTT
jgi:hypothetical protein